jgi:hypothetical protein
LPDVPFTDSIIAVPSAYREGLQPFEVSFVLDTDDPSVDLTQTVSVRALVRRSDGAILHWAFDVASDPAPTASAISVTHTANPEDFFWRRRRGDRARDVRRALLRHAHDRRAPSHRNLAPDSGPLLMDEFQIGVLAVLALLLLLAIIGGLTDRGD